MARTAKRHVGEKDKIAMAAESAIVRMGLQKCSLKDIASEAGVTTGKLMYYFRDKEELLFYAKNRLFNQVWAKAKAVSASHEGIDKLVAMSLVELPLTTAGLQMQKVLATFKVLALSNPAVRRKQVLRDQKGWQQIEEVINQLQDDGIVSRAIDSSLAAFSIIAFIEGISSHFIIAPKVQSKESIKKIVTLHIYAMLGSTPPSA